MADVQDSLINPRSVRFSRPSLLACLPCRNKHLKCDGIVPRCGRCSHSGTECIYNKSRRGYKGSSKQRSARSRSQGRGLTLSSPSIVDLDAGQNIAGDLQDVPEVLSLVPNEAVSDLNDSLATWAPSADLGIGSLSPVRCSSTSGDDSLVGIYYAYFHPAHSILPPLQHLQQTYFPFYLEQVIKFVAAHFTSAVSSEAYRPTVVTAILEQPATLEKLQALLLLIITLHSRNECAEAGICLATAVDLAFELKLHQVAYAEACSNSDSIRVECCRRAWWELFVVEGFLTAFGVQQVYRTSLVPPEVPLPCEDSNFKDGPTAPFPLTFSRFEERVFSDEERDFSSHAYRIEAMRILGRVMALPKITVGQEDQVEALDARIVSWFHHLPNSKAEPFRPDGSVDEIMFQAIIIVNSASIYLNFPCSDLLSSPAVASEVICGHHGCIQNPVFTRHTHAMKAIKAASELSSLAAINLSVQKHTPFLICALTISCIVQLAACSMKAGQIPEPSRDRIGLTIGVLKSLSRTWAISKSIMHHIKAVARDVLGLGVRASMDLFDFTAMLDVNGRFWADE